MFRQRLLQQCEQDKSSRSIFGLPTSLIQQQQQQLQQVPQISVAAEQQITQLKRQVGDCKKKIQELVCCLTHKD